MLRPFQFSDDADFIRAYHVCRLRRRLAPFGYTVTVRRRPAFTGPLTATLRGPSPTVSSFVYDSDLALLNGLAVFVACLEAGENVTGV